MIRANVYSLEPLSTDVSEAVRQGIDMVADYMGHTVATQELLLKRLPLNSEGNVRPGLVSFRKLDKFVELHLMAVPLDRGAGERIGLAGVGRGWAFVNTSDESLEVITTTSAHETGHAFGFVTPASPNSDPRDPHHCRDIRCLMNKKVVILESDEEVSTGFSVSARSAMDRLFLRRPPRTASPRPSRRVHQQHDFCDCCKADMRQAGNENIAKLRSARLFEWGKVAR